MLRTGKVFAFGGARGSKCHVLAGLQVVVYIFAGNDLRIRKRR